MFRRLGRVVYKGHRANTALRTPIEAFKNPEFVNTQLSSTFYLQQNLISSDFFLFFMLNFFSPILSELKKL